MPSSDTLHDALVESGLDPVLESQADVSDWDTSVAESMARAFAAAGPDAASPTIVIEGELHGALSGPVVSPAPTGEAALRLWDAFLTLVEVPGFVELRRTRTPPIVFPAVW